MLMYVVCIVVIAVGIGKFYPTISDWINEMWTGWQTSRRLEQKVQEQERAERHQRAQAEIETLALLQRLERHEEPLANAGPQRRKAA